MDPKGKRRAVVFALPHVLFLSLLISTPELLPLSPTQGQEGYLDVGLGYLQDRAVLP